MARRVAPFPKMLKRRPGPAGPWPAPDPASPCRGGAGPTSRSAWATEPPARSSGQLLAVVGSETFEPPNQGIASPLWILDATAAVTAPPLTVEPQHLSTWRNPGGAAAGNLGLSVHFFRLDGGLLYVSHYHGGVWAIDLRTPEKQSKPQDFGYIMPIPPGAIAPPEDCCIGFDLDGAPMVFDVAVKDGTVYAADIIQGVTATRFDSPN